MIWLAALPLMGCQTRDLSQDRGPQETPRQAVVTQDNPAFDAWVAGFRPRAIGAGISERTFDQSFRQAGFIPGVIERDNDQFQNRRSVEDYIALATSDDRLSTGRAMLRQFGPVLSAIGDRYGVPAEVITAIWGVESRYGGRRGSFPTISSLATLAFASRRARFFESQLIGALRILQQGDTTPENMRGSWAGAMGHTQFIPTTYLAYAVDFDGDGRRDIWAEDPTDALASAAAYLSRSGWRRGQRWADEVRVPEGRAVPRSSKGAPRQSVAAWQAAGVTGIGRTLAGSGSASLIRPGGTVGPALLIYDNFRTLLRYNNSDAYAVAVGHLSDRLAGGGPFRTSFGVDAFGLTLDERKRLQRALAAEGYDLGTIDGVLGPKTEAAVRAEQAKRGLPVTGTPSREFLARL